MLFILVAAVFFLAACSNKSNPHQNHTGSMEPNIQKTGAQPVFAKKNGDMFEITAQQGMVQLKGDKKWNIWAYDGMNPGPTIRVKQGEMVKVKLKNKLPEPVTIHWHGLPVPNKMDGVAGLTQNAVEPGKEFVYEFEATVPGTYWYHSHQNSAEQVDKGLYGTVIVEPKDEKVKYNRDYTLVFDEWKDPEAEGGNGSQNGSGGMDHSSMNQSGNDMNMDHSSMNSNDSNMNMDHSAHGNMQGMSMDHMKDYKTFTINGKAAPETEPLMVKKGDLVKLRLVNAGFMTHKIHIHGHSVKVTNMDGQPINKPQEFKDQLIAIAPGERYEVEFKADQSGKWLIECHGQMEGTKDMKTFIRYEENASNQDKANEGQELPVLDITSYGEKVAETNDSFDKEYTVDLGEKMDNNMNEIFTINGNTFKTAKPFMVKQGDKVKMTLTNTGKQDHPMHLHGHFFKVLSKNGKSLTGSPIMKDTLNVRPGESYEISFTADNPGDWMFHCHDLHHAAAGMATTVKYEGYSSFKPDPEVRNISE